MKVPRLLTALFLTSALVLPTVPAVAVQQDGKRPPGQSKQDTLRRAAPKDFNIGSAVAGGGHHETQDYPDPFTFDKEYRRQLAAEFNSVSPENQAKWEFIHPEKDVYRFAEMDSIVRFAQKNKQAVRGHTLFWHSQNPEWLEQGNFSKEELRGILKDHVQTVVGRYAGKIQQWDVANEIFNDDGTLRTTENIWLRELGPDIIADVFQWAHEADPSAKLFFNDFGVEDINPKSNAYLELIPRLQAQGVQVDGFAIQGHLSTRYGFPDALQANLQRFDDLGLETAITEIDVRMDIVAGTEPTPEQLAQQADYYQRALKACLSVEDCNSFTIWGFTDKYSWVPVFFAGEGEATVMEEDFTRKPAYYALRKTLKDPSSVPDDGGGSQPPPTGETPGGVSSGFETGTDGWAARGDGVLIEQGSDARTGTGNLLVTNRSQDWHGAALDVTGALPVGAAVRISVWAKLAPGQEPASLKISVQRDNGGGSAYEGVAGASASVTADGWTELTGTYTLGAAADKAQVYVEGTAGVDYLLDDFSLAEVPEIPIQTNVPALKDVLGAQGIEHVGAAIDARETAGSAANLMRKHFNAFTPENAGKPESVQPVEGQFTFTQLDQLLDFADANNVQVYGHVLVWHSQTPEWFFKDGSRDLTGNPADRALLKARMEAHIKGIADHIDARYPNGDSPIWAWDVVNETIADGDTANPHDMRDSRWFQILGERYVDEAFRLADRYFPEAKLFINDYNTEMPAKRADYLDLIRALEARGVPIDGVGHQAHVDVARPVQWLEDSIRAVEKVNPDLLQAITELDVNASTENQGADVGGAPVDPYSPAFENDADAAAEVGYYYRDLFAMLRRQSSAIDSVTFWGISNARSWLRTWPMARPWEQPLPFDDDLQVTPAYWGIVDPAKLPARPADVLAPRIADQPDVVAYAKRAGRVKVSYPLPSAIDTLDGKVPVNCSPRRGGSFAVGTTTVTCTATDAAGNTRTNSFDVVVKKHRHSGRH
ncbi:endo-1,4-beta-xylanase [Arthrobacter sp. 08Y14]|uniref:endo-1,4-beta-xylanase n=1 Tax=Arthrobacter sp. 08Y14 TaxID=2058885 RepID=UPI0021586E87|nr:endo-1,4-beta-xylanase [Arthrobacter sp. 08Y14]